MSKLAYLVGGVAAAIVANVIMTDLDATAVGVAAEDTGTAAVVEQTAHCQDSTVDATAENTGDACT